MSASEETPTTPAEDYRATRMEAWLLRFGTIGELLAMLAAGGRWWMVPLVLVFAAVGLVLVFLQSVQYVAPFIYMVF